MAIGGMDGPVRNAKALVSSALGAGRAMKQESGTAERVTVVQQCVAIVGTAKRLAMNAEGTG